MTLKSFDQIKNLPVVDETKTAIGYIENVFVDENGFTVGFRIDQEGMFLPDCILPISAEFTSMNDEFIISKADLVSFADQAEKHSQIDAKNGIIGRRIIEQDGELKGIVENVYFSSNLDRLEMIEFTEGWFSDLKEGRKHLSYKDVIQIGKDTLQIVRGGTCGEMPKLSQ